MGCDAFEVGGNRICRHHLRVLGCDPDRLENVGDGRPHQPLRVDRNGRGAAEIAPASAGILVVGVPGRPLGIMRTVVDLDHDRLLVRQRRSVHVALRVPVERARGQRDAGLGVFVTFP